MNLESTDPQAVLPVPTNSPNKPTSNTVKRLEDYRDEPWYEYVNDNLICGLINGKQITMKSADDRLIEAYKIAIIEYKKAIDLVQPVDPAWEYIIGVVNYRYKQNTSRGIYYLLRASNGDKNQRSPEALYLLGHICEDRGKIELACTFYSLAYISGNCDSAYIALTDLLQNKQDIKKYLDHYRDFVVSTKKKEEQNEILRSILTPDEYRTLQLELKSGGRHTLRKKNPTKRRAPRKSTKRNKKRSTYKRRK